MAGYQWDPVVKIVPQNGNEYVYWFADQLTDLGGTRRVTPRYKPIIREYEDINRDLQQNVEGYRVEVDLECVITSMADQAFLADIENKLMLPSEFDVYLSIDGGCVFRQVRLRSGADPEPLAAKTILGATFKLGLVCKTPIPSKPASMIADPGVGSELVQNGSFENWNPLGTIPNGWTPNSEITCGQQGNPGFYADGSWSCEATKTGLTANYGALVHDAPITLAPGSWYRLRAKALGGQTTSNGLGVQLWNMSFPGSTGPLPYALWATPQRPAPGTLIRTWNTGQVVAQDINTSGFAEIDVYFRGPVTPFKSTDQFGLRLHGIQTQTHKAYYDAVSIFGPVLRPGVATW